MFKIEEKKNVDLESKGLFLRCTCIFEACCYQTAQKSKNLLTKKSAAFF